jgi:hypothetical protein
MSMKDKSSVKKEDGDQTADSAVKEDSTMMPR